MPEGEERNRNRSSLALTRWPPLTWARGIVLEKARGREGVGEQWAVGTIQRARVQFLSEVLWLVPMHRPQIPSKAKNPPLLLLIFQTVYKGDTLGETVSWERGLAPSALGGEGESTEQQ